MLKFRKKLTAILAASMILLFHPLSHADTKDLNGPNLLLLKQNKGLRIIHMNDIHSHLDETETSITIDGKKTYVQIGGMARAVNKIKQLAAENRNHLILNGGDTVQGTLYYTLFRGEATAKMLNLVDWDAIVLGNHEFDDGDDNLANYIDLLNSEVVAANVKPAAGNILENKWQPYLIKTINGKKVGIIGIDVRKKTEESSNPSDEITFLDEIPTVQTYANILQDKGIDRIILLSHYGLSNDIELARQVSGIDVIIGGDSHSLMGDFSAFDLSSQNQQYPVMETSKTGEPVCIAQAWDYSKVVGSLDVDFDKNGVLTGCQGRAVLMLGGSFQRKNDNGDKVDVVDEELEQIIATINQHDNVEIVNKDEVALATLTSYKNKVDDLKNEVIGKAGEKLSHLRIPGEDYLGNIGTDFPKGSEIAPIVAKSFYQLSNRADACIQNAGGVRINVEAGDITYDTAYTLLPFANTLFEIEMKGSEIKQVLEDAIYNFYDNGGSTGSFPYAYGLRYDIDMSAPAYQRVKNLEIKDRESGNWANIDNDTMYVIVTNSYIAGGKDGYTTFKTVQDERGPGVDTYLDYAMSFVNYVKELDKAGQQVMPLPDAEHCIKSFHF